MVFFTFRRTTGANCKTLDASRAQVALYDTIGVAQQADNAICLSEHVTQCLIADAAGRVERTPTRFVIVVGLVYQTGGQQRQQSSIADKRDMRTLRVHRVQRVLIAFWLSGARCASIVARMDFK